MLLAAAGSAASATEVGVAGDPAVAGTFSVVVVEEDPKKARLKSLPDC
jgi:hypothetical protein